MSPATAVVLDRPTPRWQARALAVLEAEPDVDVVAVSLVDAPRAGLADRLRGMVERRGLGFGGDGLAPEPGGVAERGGAAGLAPGVLRVWLAEGAPARAAAGERLLVLRHAGGTVGGLEAAFAAAVASGARTVTTEALLDGEVVARTTSGVRTFSPLLGAGYAGFKLAALVARTAGRAQPPAAAAAAPARTLAAAAPWPLLARVAARIAAVRVLHVLLRRPWAVIVRRRGADAPLEGWDRAAPVAIPWEDGHVYADPMFFEHGGLHHLFVEDVAPGTGRGVIAHVALDAAGVAQGPLRTVMTAPHHLSYPYVFDGRDGDIYMIPETAAARRVELHRAISFPDSWELVTVLLDEVDAVDATVFPHAGRWWMLAGVAAPGASTLDELHAFSADGPRGPFAPHPANPVVSDASYARPGGPPIDLDGRLIRTGQDGARRYGEAISLLEIETLTAEAYAERPLAHLRPEAIRGARAVHTYASDSAFEAIDVRLRTPRLLPQWTLGRGWRR